MRNFARFIPKRRALITINNILSGHMGVTYNPLSQTGEEPFTLLGEVRGYKEATFCQCLAGRCHQLITQATILFVRDLAFEPVGPCHSLKIVHRLPQRPIQLRERRNRR